VLAAVGVGCWVLAPLFSTLAPSPVFMAELHRTSLPPYEQLLVVEGSGAVGVIVSPSRRRPGPVGGVGAGSSS